MWNIITILKNRFLFECILKCNLFLWCKAEFSASSLQSSVLRDSAEIIPTCRFAAQETFIIFINVENSCAVSYFCGNCGMYFWIYDKYKAQSYKYSSQHLN